MIDLSNPSNEFLSKVIAIIRENLSDEYFGVPELADRLNMSRSNLLRKVKKHTGVSVSVLIRKVRLQRAKELLGDGSVTASEVCFKVGFGSTSYFTKCFREEFGYTPGDEKRVKEESRVNEPVKSGGFSSRGGIFLSIFIILGIAIVSLIIFKGIRSDSFDQQPLDKSIAVLPFKNDSNDSTNVYLINGLMEAILNNLQKVEDLKVTSRTTVERYRTMQRTIPELSEELEVSYFVEGSGQKIGNEIMLTVQLIEGPSDLHIWANSYRRKTDDIFQLQMEVAKHIAAEIQAVITPDEQKRIEKIPTENLKAYDFYLKGKEEMYKETQEGLIKAIELYQEAIKEDTEFAQAYAYIAVCYYFLDLFQVEKQHSDKINTYADNALLLDEDLGESLIAKALFYMQDEQYELAIKYFEKVLEFNPNLGWVHNFLSDIYTSYLPNTRKYLTHALRGIKTATSGQDSSTASHSYLHLSNALIQTGFVNESEKYILRSLDYNPDNIFSLTVLTYIRLAQNLDLNRAKNELITILQKDTTRLDVIQEIAKICYMMEDYEASWKYYEILTSSSEKYGLNIYPAEDIKIGYVLHKLGREEEAEKYYSQFKTFADNNQSIYRSMNKSAYHAVKGEIEAGIEHLKEFSNHKDFYYWVVLLIDKDPIIRELSSHPDYEKTLKLINDNFWESHEEILQMLKEEGVM